MQCCVLICINGSGGKIVKLCLSMADKTPQICMTFSHLLKLFHIKALIIFNTILSCCILYIIYHTCLLYEHTQNEVYMHRQKHSYKHLAASL